MRRWRNVTVLVALALLAVAAAGADKDKGKKKDSRAGNSTADLVEQAREKQAAGDTDGALELLTEAAAHPGAAGQVSLPLAQVLLAKGQLDGAADALQAAANGLAGAARGEALGRLSIIDELRGRESGASAELALAADSQGPWPLVAAAFARGRAGQPEEALNFARRAEVAGPGALGAGALGRAHEAARDWAAAEGAYRQALGEPGLSAIATLGLARSLRGAGRPAEALPLLRETIDRLPGVLQAYKEAARVELALQKPDEAFVDASVLAAMAEDDTEALALRDECAVAKALRDATLGRAVYAQEDLQRLLTATPNSARLHLGVGRLHVVQRQADPALAALARALELDPRLVEAQFYTGYVHHLLRRDAGSALPFYERALAADPTNLEYRTQLGAVLVALGQQERAVAELTPVTTSPGYAGAEGFMYLGAAQLGAKRYAEALATLQKAGSIAPDNAQIETFMAWACFGLKDSKGFLDHGRRAKTLGQQDATLLGYLTRVEKGEAIK